MSMLVYNHILAADSYKPSHQFVYPENVVGLFSYGEARKLGHTIIPFGMQMWLKKFLSIPVTYEMIDEAEEILTLHGEPFDRKPWEKIITHYDGFLPLTIRSVKEGTPMPSGHPIFTCECTDPDLFWLASYIETNMQRAIWYPTTVASQGYATKQILKAAYEKTGADVAMIPFALHDFGARGTTCAEQAEIGGLAHLVNFKGTDTLEALRAGRAYYNEKMAGFSVPATEHSIECSYGKEPEQELEYLRTVLRKLGKPGKVVSAVIDGYDVMRAALAICVDLHDEIIESGVKFVFRPDSGDMNTIVPEILDMQAKYFGYTVNEAGYKKIKHVGLLQGDGINPESLKELLDIIIEKGYAADNIVFGSGGALLQKVNRDTFSFAMKASAKLVNGKWVGVKKEPITDSGKNSKAGRLTVAKYKDEFVTLDAGNWPITFVESIYDKVMEVVYDHGKILVNDTFETIRNRTEGK